MLKLLVRTCFFAPGLLLYALPAQAQLPAGLPDAAKPAAQIPQEVFLYPELEPEPGKYIVPPVVDRPLGVAEGPRIKIDAFELRGVVDRPDQGLKVEEVWKIIETSRTAHPDGLTIGELQELANEITNYYRDRGFIVAHAFIPVQTVEDGIVTIQVLEGVLGRVLVEGNKRYKPEMLGVPFEDLLGKPLTKAKVESALVRMGDYPGLTTFGIFQPGEEVGDSDLVLKVQEEKGSDIVFSLNNHGSQFTGEYLAAVDIGINNMFRQADRLDMTFQQSYDPSLANYKSIEYSQMLFKPQYRIEVGYTDSEFDIAPGGTGIQGLRGLSQSAYIRFRNDIERSRLRNSYWLFSLDGKLGETYQVDNLLARDSLAVLSIEYGFDSLDAETQGLNNFVVKYSHGQNFLGAMDAYNDPESSRITGSGDRLGSRFDKIFLSYTRLQTISPTSSFLFRSNIQYTDNPLVGLEQYAMGGPDNVRAYAASENTVDRGFFLSAEYILNAPGFADKPSPFGNRKWGEVFTVSGFLDWAHGELIDPLSSQSRYESLKGVGFGTQLLVPGSFTAKMTAAWPTLDSIGPANKRRPQVFFSFEADLY